MPLLLIDARAVRMANVENFMVSVFKSIAVVIVVVDGVSIDEFLMIQLINVKNNAMMENENASSS